jgi:hypothetical protein
LNQEGALLKEGGTHGDFKGRAAKLSRVRDDGNDGAIGIAISDTHNQDGTGLGRHPEVE